MTEFTTRTTSPFRYDIVGSFLRPQELKEARAKFAKRRNNTSRLNSC